MSHIVERGECLSNATSLASVTDYHGFLDLNFIKHDCVPEDPDIEKALNTASRMLSEQLTWKGCQSTRRQYLAFPRSGMTDCDGCCIPSCEIPTGVIEATIILAYQLLKGEISVFTNETNAKVTSLSMDKYSITFAGAGAAMKQNSDCGGTMTISADKFSAVRHLIKCYLSNQGGIRIRRS